MTEKISDFSALQVELEADIATLSAIANVKLATLRQYQRQLLILRMAKPPCFYFSRLRLLFECKEERRTRQCVLDTIVHQGRMLANLSCDAQLRL